VVGQREVQVRYVETPTAPGIAITGKKRLPDAMHTLAGAAGRQAEKKKKRRQQWCAGYRRKQQQTKAWWGKRPYRMGMGEEIRWSNGGLPCLDARQPR
jgi:hypothetical protein